MNRREALRTLAAGSVAGALVGGIAIMATPSAADAAADPCLAFVTGWEEAGEHCGKLLDEDIDGYWESYVRPFEEIATYGTIPAATSAEGAATALRKALAFGDMEQQDANLVRAALAYLEGRA
ncbi:hypothetical protein [Aureimonas sp. AU20]|uniref:hypothetical protein n=1 Tax=Aureimonas sp. AU20 TaxID=1349819 RepID=UPI00071EBBB8|nr:hypothetical protein [Aureimonas sp. AU20]ALN75819.1 hypothetical protein M673_24000 [Aureimonas sp. AU20]